MQAATVALSYLGVVQGTSKPCVKCRQTSIKKNKIKKNLKASLHLPLTKSIDISELLSYYCVTATKCKYALISVFFSMYA